MQALTLLAVVAVVVLVTGFVVFMERAQRRIRVIMRKEHKKKGICCTNKSFAFEINMSGVIPRICF